MCKKFVSALVVAFLLTLVTVSAFAAVKVAQSGTDKGVVEQINFTAGPVVTRAGQIATVSLANETGNKTITGNLTVTGIIVDSSIYSATAGVGGNRTVCASADGKLFTSAVACP